MLPYWVDAGGADHYIFPSAMPVAHHSKSAGACLSRREQEPERPMERPCTNESLRPTGPAYVAETCLVSQLERNSVSFGSRGISVAAPAVSSRRAL
jgi:hypothetical protein